MQTARSLCFRQLTRAGLLRRATVQCKRHLATDSNSPAAGPVPWFVDQEYEQPQRSLLEQTRPTPPHMKETAPTAPEDAPEAVKLVHAALSQSPHLDLSTLVASRAPEIPPGPPLPLKAPQGRRMRGSTYGGESSFDVPGSIWSWTVMAQVKEGTENRGAIESVVRVIRKTLTAIEPPLPDSPQIPTANGHWVGYGGCWRLRGARAESRSERKILWAR